jgi:hypothetical protein
MSKKKFLLVGLVGNLALLGLAPFSYADSAAATTAASAAPITNLFPLSLQVHEFDEKQNEIGNFNEATAAGKAGIAGYFKQGSSSYVGTCAIKAIQDVKTELDGIAKVNADEETDVTDVDLADNDSTPAAPVLSDIQKAMSDYKNKCKAKANPDLKLGITASVVEHWLTYNNTMTGPQKYLVTDVTFVATMVGPNGDASPVKITTNVATGTAADFTYASTGDELNDIRLSRPVSCSNETRMISDIKSHESTIRKNILTQLQNQTVSCSSGASSKDEATDVLKEAGIAQ